MSDQVWYVADITRTGRFGYTWNAIERHRFTSSSSHTILGTGYALTEGGARRASKRAVKRRRRELRWDVFSTAEEISP